jgi:hypothetical protein
MTKRVFGVLFAALLLVGALPGVALAAPKEGRPEPPQGTFTVTCPDFETGYGTFTQRLPNSAKHGSDKSLEHSAGGQDCN